MDFLLKPYTLVFLSLKATQYLTSQHLKPLTNQQKTGGCTAILTIFFAAILAFSSSATAATEPSNQNSFTLFESGQVRPLALSPDENWLFAVNTPAGKLEVFRVTRLGLRHQASVQVGLEPVAVAAPNDSEVWVVNHLSDSVNIVARKGQRWQVESTLYVGDEPRDIVFAQTRGGTKRAFITTTHRGQNVPYDPQFTSPGIGRADVWVFDVEGAKESDHLGGKPLTILTLFADTPRALARSRDGSKVYAAGFLTGNGTTVIPEEVVTNSIGLPPPLTNFEGIDQPPTSLIVRFNGQHWVDERNRVWDDHVYLSLPDKDVFTIDNSGAIPKELDTQSFSGVGTVLFNIAIHPKTGEVFVSNTEARNHERFEGPGNFAGHSLRGRVVENRISILQPDGSVLHRNLNKHINSDEPCCKLSPIDTKARSLAFPMGMEFSKDGRTLYVAALGSSKIGVFDTEALRNDTFVPSPDHHIMLTGGGPTGLVLDERRNRMYVLTRFNNSVAIVNTLVNLQIDSVPLYNPEPEHIVQGRQFLYDARLSSSNGDTACASCHVFGDMDGLAWDLGNPDAIEINNPGPFKLTPEMVGFDTSVHFRPLKGPMTTQSLRGMDNHGPMHWRGDRTGGNSEPSMQPNSGTFDERAAFEQFNEAFVQLNGNEHPLPPEQFELFTDFVLDLTYPPNPIRNLDNSLTPEQQFGHDFYFERVSDRLFTCNGCHLLNSKGNSEYGVKHPGFFGTDGSYSFEFEPQTIKIPHFRNLYQKVGMFGMAPISKLLPDNEDGTNQHRGDQIRGFGYQHDGAIDTLERFISTTLFRFIEPQPPLSPGNPGGFSNDPKGGLQERRSVESFLLAFDTNLAPIVGQQVTLTHRNLSASIPRMDLLVSRASLGECDLMAVTATGHIYQLIDGEFVAVASPGARGYPTDQVVRHVLRRKSPVTLTCTPPGSAQTLAGMPAEAEASDGWEFD